VVAHVSGAKGVVQMNRILLSWFVCGALFSALVRAQASDTATDSVPPIDSHAAERARLELTKGAVDLALVSAESKLAERHFDDAIAMAWAGLEQADKLLPSDERSTLVQLFMQVIIDSRVQKQLFSEGRPSDKVVRADPLSASPVPRNYDPGTGLSTVRPPKNQTPLAEALAGLGEDPELDEKIVVYPEDWQSSKAGTGNSAGVLYEGPPFEDDQGQVVKTIVYDVRSLLLPRLNFQYIPLGDLHGISRTISDREALRRSSEIFNGDADDLAAGIPLLGYFGGVGNWPATIGDGQQEMAELARIIEEMTAP